jgi:hypothetical protein
MFAELRSQLLLRFLQVEGFHGCTRSSIDSRFVANNLASQWLWEASHRLTKVTLEEVDDGGWEIELVGPLEHILLGEVVGGQPLGEVSDYLRRWSDLFQKCQTRIPWKCCKKYLDDVSAQVVCFNVLLLDDCKG